MFWTDLQVLKSEYQDTESYKKCPAWTVHHWTCASRRNQEEASFDQEQESEQEVTLGPPQAFWSMFMPYIEGPKMDWTVNENLYNRFLKWKLKCENIMECELVMLVETRTCIKVIASSWDFVIDQYVSWCLPQKNCAWMSFGPNLKSSVNHRKIKSEQGLTC